MRKRLITLLALLPLAGCVPSVFLAGATAGGAILYDKRSIKTMTQDRRAADTAQTILDNDPQLKNRSHLSAAVFNHILLLVGQTETAALRAHAYSLVTNLPNIHRVFNEISLASVQSMKHGSNDAWITTKVKSAMLAKPGLRSTEIKVVTENKVVYLMGIITPKQATLATNIARRVKGVSKVVKVFQYQE